MIGRDALVARLVRQGYERVDMGSPGTSRCGARSRPLPLAGDRPAVAF